MDAKTIWTALASPEMVVLDGLFSQATQTPGRKKRETSAAPNPTAAIAPPENAAFPWELT